MGDPQGLRSNVDRLFAHQAPPVAIKRTLQALELLARKPSRALLATLVVGDR
jgi:hypothetical protein